MLLADEQEPAGTTPPIAEPAAAEVTPAGVTVEHRDILVAAAHGERAEGDDPELALQLRLSLGESVRLEVGRGAVAQLIHLGDVLLALGLAAEVLHEEDLVARGLVHPLAQSVLLERTAVVEDRHVALAVLLIEVGLGWQPVGDGDEVLALAERLLGRGTGGDDELGDLLLQGRLLHDPPQVLYGAALGENRVGDHLEDFEREPEVAHHVADSLILLVLSHGRLSVSPAHPLTPQNAEPQGLPVCDRKLSRHLKL